MENQNEHPQSKPQVIKVKDKSRHPKDTETETKKVTIVEPEEIKSDNNPSAAGAAADQSLLDRMLAMAQGYRSEGNLQQAAELYLTLAESYPGTYQAETARRMLLEVTTSLELDMEMLERLLAMAQRYRNDGNLREAAELYMTLAESYPGTHQAEMARRMLLEVTTILELDMELLERLLAMAQRYRSEGNLHQATDIYWTLVDVHPGTLQADAARAELLGIADEYEQKDDRHMARSIYERLMSMEK
ncbi:MAG: tetratricopeptide repeat protein [Candidatus Nitrotoga sp.]|nr:tetratricopeptide repeat protein [Candidatus Nitrotoga sp.]